MNQEENKNDFTLKGKTKDGEDYEVRVIGLGDAVKEAVKDVKKKLEPNGER